MDCANLIQCLLADEDTRSAVIELLIESGSIGAGAGGQSVGLQTIYTEQIGALPGCDDDDRYGVAYNIVAMLNTVTEDMLDIVELILEQAEMAVALIQWIPLLGAFVESARAAATYVITSVAPVYRAAYNTTTHETLACAIYCKIPADGCTVTLQSIIEAYEELLADFNPPGAFAGIVETMEWYASLVLDTDLAIAGLMQLLILSVFVRGGTFMAVPRTVLSIAIETSIPITVPCDECPAECFQWLSGGLPYTDWDILEYAGYSGTYNEASDRFEAVWDHVHGSGKFIFVGRDFTGLSVSSIKVSWECHNTRSVSGVFQLLDGATSLYFNNSYPPDGSGVQSFTIDPPREFEGEMKILLACRTWDDDEDAYAYITKIEVCYAA